MDSVLINTPVSSPLHPQLNLPLLKGYLGQHGFATRIIDSNILFFRSFLGEDLAVPDCDVLMKNPLEFLDFYNSLEQKLWEKSGSHVGLHVGLRHLNMHYDRIHFESVLAAVRNQEANPFVAFYEDLVAQAIGPEEPKIVGIAITFQDQIIPAFTLASILRLTLPDTAIVMGGQMVSRCYQSMRRCGPLCKLCDYLVLWDGEKTLLDVHRHVIREEKVDWVNVIETGNPNFRIDRKANCPDGDDIPSPDFADTDFPSYFLPEPLVPIQTTRGCYGSCVFCAIPFGSNSYRVRSVEDIIADIHKIQKLTEEQCGRKATFFKFMEDTSSPKLLYELAQEIERRKIDAKWETFARLERAFTGKGFMQQLYRGGCRKIHWGLESNDPDILKGMNKKTSVSYADEVLRLASEADILNFCFVLVGFPGETEEMRKRLVRYIVDNPHIHTLTLSTFDLTRNSPMDLEFDPENEYGLSRAAASDFQVRLPYTVNGEDWKKEIVEQGHAMVLDIIRERPDIGLATLFPDQIRSLLCERYTNNWGKSFLESFGKDNVKEMLINTEKYIQGYGGKLDVDPLSLPEPLRREHFRTKEDLMLIANAAELRHNYEKRRMEHV